MPSPNSIYGPIFAQPTTFWKMHNLKFRLYATGKCSSHNPAAIVLSVFSVGRKNGAQQVWFISDKKMGAEKILSSRGVAAALLARRATAADGAASSAEIAASSRRRSPTAATPRRPDPNSLRSYQNRHWCLLFAVQP